MTLAKEIPSLKRVRDRKALSLSLSRCSPSKSSWGFRTNGLKHRIIFPQKLRCLHNEVEKYSLKTHPEVSWVSKTSK